MSAAIRPFVTTGVALVGASLIAVTPIAPAPTPQIRVASPPVQLTVYENPIYAFFDVTDRALRNAGLLAEAYLAEPFPIIQAILGNEVTAPTDILTALWWVGSSAVSWVIAPVVNTIQTIGTAAALVIVGPSVGVPLSVAIISAVGMIISIPFDIADGVLNGNGNELPGLLNPGPLGPSFGSPPLTTPGFIGSLIALDRAIGAAISSLFHPSPTPLAPVNEPPTPQATTLTLSTGSSLDTGSTPAGQELGTAGSDVAAPAQPGLATAAAGAVNATDGVATSGANASEQAEQGLANALAGSNATEGLDTVDANASAQADQELGTVQAAGTTERSGGATDLTDGNKVTPGQAPLTKPAEHASDVLEDGGTGGTGADGDGGPGATGSGPLGTSGGAGGTGAPAGPAGAGS